MLLPPGQAATHCFFFRRLERGLTTDAGKSSLTVQYVDGHFVESYYPTVENTFSKTIKHKGQEFSTEIVDTAGQVPFNVSLHLVHLPLD